ncbi:unnamed protein product [Acanthoscelides obtectus]|uniref:Uncharacterized protein n=1 Tax=Acanthoscelides obtectus TaxID=200917 RepID=A0A9P0LRZ0_ACAOB|nr:unnamed protein product [Acanthoscelides obtectus]CAK1658574.1 hypothetical protein AOBTE_LOCUS20997 [Acanthoscelides obtectus]
MNGIVKKVVNLMKLAIIGIVVVVKVWLLLKIFYAAIKLKYALITFGYLVLSYIKVWLDAHQHQSHQKKVIYHTYPHDHHKLDELDLLGEHEGEEYWRRNDIEEDPDTIGNDVEYDRQKSYFLF